MDPLYGSVQEQNQHSSAIHAIALQYHMQESLVREIYEQDLKTLKSAANIKSYLSVLVSRHVIEHIRKGMPNMIQ